MLKTEFSFQLITQNDEARLGKIITQRGNIIHQLLCLLELKELLKEFLQMIF